MHIVSYRAVRQFVEMHPESAGPLNHWYRVAKRAAWSSFADVKFSFNTADVVAPYIVFNVGGNKYRLVASIHFGARTLFIRAIMSHKEYERGGWKS